MQGVSEIILRNVASLPAGDLLLVNPPRDLLFRHLQDSGHRVRVSTQDYGDFRWLEGSGAQAAFDRVAQAVPDSGAALLFLPREKSRLELLLHGLAASLPADAQLWVSGENRAGIKSCPRHLQRFFDTVEKRDSARHCTLFSAAQPLRVPRFDLDDYEASWTLDAGGRRLEIKSFPGVFAHGRLDPGSALLLQALEALKPAGRVLDLACSAGVIGLSLLAAGRTVELTLLDVYSLALEASRRSLAANGLQATVLASDGLRELSGRFDWIVSNPPFHRGVGADLDVAADFFAAAGTSLSQSGTMLIVCNRHLPYFRGLQEYFRQVEECAGNREFRVLAARQR
ncbi:MAG: methyltransferase [Xanthomonadales bacterium]|nr:methyltransferase [Xanthomonadales bacterium]